MNNEKYPKNRLVSLLAVHWCDCDQTGGNENEISTFKRISSDRERERYKKHKTIIRFKIVKIVSVKVCQRAAVAWFRFFLLHHYSGALIVWFLHFFWFKLFYRFPFLRSIHSALTKHMPNEINALFSRNAIRCGIACCSLKLSTHASGRLNEQSKTKPIKVIQRNDENSICKYVQRLQCGRCLIRKM